MNEAIKEAIEILKAGGIILYPTDTIWGIGCDATNAEAVEKVYKIKKRADSKSLIILVSDMDMICRYVDKIPEMAVDMAEITSNPLTIIYPKGINLAPNVIAEDGSVGIRIPYYNKPEDDEDVSYGNAKSVANRSRSFKNNTLYEPFCTRLIRKYRKPIVSTSANISGEASALKFSEISEEILKQVDWVAPKDLESKSSHKSSSIVKIDLDGSVKVIR